MPLVNQRLAQLLQEAALEAQHRGLMPPVALPEVTVERPQNLRHGDYAANLPLRLARAAGMSPMVIGQRLVSLLPTVEEVERVEVAAPGFINFTLSPSWLVQQVEAVLAAGARYGNAEIGRGAPIQVEYVSANPTGPLHVGNGRGAVLGSTLARVLAAAGYQVAEEYYINDAGSQLAAFGRSLYARYLQALGREAAMPADGYLGAYVETLAQEITAAEGERFLQLSPEGASQELGKLACQRMVQGAREDLEALGVRYDRWFSEQSLFPDGLFDETLAKLRGSGHVVEKEGALWLAALGLGEEKESVLIRSNGAPTYLATDIVYHYEKLARRGYEWVVDIWGADHHGHVSPLKAGVAALGLPPERLQIILYQWVHIRRGDQLVGASKRAGELVTLREVLHEVGPDACRYFFLAHSPDTSIDFDLELAKRQSAENPVYYIQYAYARLSSILRRAQQEGVSAEGCDLNLLSSEAELALLRKMIELPELVESVARQLEPHHFARYALELATDFHDFYERCRVISEDRALSAARLRLTQAAHQVLAETLDLMGLSAPERM